MNRLSSGQTFLATYRQYKEDTNYVANCLAETAQSIGYEPVEEKCGQSRQRVRNRNKKGKGKKTHFVPIAEAIADNKEKILVPVALSRFLNRTIQTRKKVTHWFKKKAFEDGHDSNEWYYYFITLLEKAFRMLKPFISSGPEAYHPPSGGPASDASGPTFENRIVNLTVEDIADIAEKEGAGEAKLPDFGDKTQEELKFAVTLFIQKLQNVIDVTCAQWVKYKYEKVDLIVPAMTTDLAIKLVQRGETEFDLVVKRPKNYPINNFPLWRLPNALIKPSLADKPLEYNGNIFWPTCIDVKQHMDPMMNWTPRNIFQPSFPNVLAVENLFWASSMFAVIECCLHALGAHVPNVRVLAEHHVTDDLGELDRTEGCIVDFLIVDGLKAANSARDIPINRLKIDQKNLREFRDPMLFGSGVFLPRNKFSKARYPKFLGIAYGLLLKTFEGYPAYELESGHKPDSAIIAIGKYNSQIAAILEAPGDLSLTNLYAHWSEEDWKPDWGEMKTVPANELKDMFMESFLSSFMSEEKKKKPKASAPVSQEQAAMDDDANYAGASRCWY
ncbi:hypothetical protein PTT_07275 [Pyrenophora teres f. teres 0-1]|uniref:DUF6604 domain-containing protein n=1 Tax=Pyrenophora teres f. teres (strain 0-1) TaxID=861557 RepID=E3RHA2_PYRTT|nr:hypothetical protein PTT_07275 [Pyrenophora teres f. teres 0-1]